MKKTVITPVLAAATLLAAPALAATSVSIGYYRASGDYGLDSDTDTDLIPLTVTHKRERWSLGLTVPWVRISGFGTVVMTGQGPKRMSVTPGQGMYSSQGSGYYMKGSGMSNTTMATARVSESGLGDISAFLGYSLLSDTPGALAATVSATVKFATGDEKKGLGTGGTDYGLEIGLAKPLADITPFLSVGYTVTGDNGEISYNDYPYFSAGADYAFSRDLSAGLAFNYSASLSDDTDDSRDLSTNLRWQMNTTWSSTATAAIGLTDSSPDTTWGLELTARF